jgi:hypothetical protein
MNDELIPDLDFWAMRLMCDDELDRFTVILENIQRENEWMDRWTAHPPPNPDQPLSAAARDEYLAHESRWRQSTEARLSILRKYADQGLACVRLVDYSLAAIERLFGEGTLDQVVDLPEFWRLVYHRILKDYGDEIRSDARFKGVKILDVLREQLTELLPGFAERHFRRKRGNPILAQLLEKLAGR